LRETGAAQSSVCTGGSLGPAERGGFGAGVLVARPLRSGATLVASARALRTLSREDCLRCREDLEPSSPHEREIEGPAV